MRGSRKDYDFDSKNRWRRMIWNLILRRTKGREKRELVLYLAGPDDFDRAVAVGRGVPSSNLIAIDRDRANIQSVRANGHLGICGDVIDVLRAWPRSKPVCAIMLDLCQGFQRLEDLHRIMLIQQFNPALGKAIIAFNLLRGRDQESEHERMIIGGMIDRQQAYQLDETCNRFHKRYLEILDGVDPKNRGLIFALWYWAKGCHAIRKEDRQMRALFDRFGWWTTALMFLTECIKPRIYTYKSATQVYDSVVLYPWSYSFEADPLLTKQERGVISSLIGDANRQVAQSTIATLAVRTRRLGGIR